MDYLTKLKLVRGKLLHHYHRFNFFNKYQVFDEILFIFLSWRTPIAKAESIYQNLNDEFVNWDKILTLTEEEWYDRIKSGGKAKDKSRTIIKLLNKIQTDFKSLKNLEQLHNWTDDTIFKYLISLPGIKDKSAYCVMLYTLKRAVFPADAHCLRITWRLGIVEGAAANKSDRVLSQKKLNSLLKGDYSLCYDLHVLLIQHGQQVCKKIPNCGKCIIRDYCDYYHNTTNPTKAYYSHDHNHEKFKDY